jgi:predicted RNase H-related nuclease YkuK (DUF458 family)
MVDIEEVKEYIRNSSEASSIYIGCDSKRFGKKDKRFVAFACVVLIHLDTKHGAKMFSFKRVERDYGSLRQRMVNEAIMACEIGYEVREAAGDRTFEIHLDINPDKRHKSNVAIKEATGMVLGMFGENPKVKPEAFAASTAADKLVCEYGGKKNFKKFLDKMKKGVKLEDMV